MSLLPLQPGTPLRSDQIRAAIQRLYGTGEYADIAVDAELANGAVMLRFLTKPNYFVGHVETEGTNPPPSSAQLYAASRLNLGAEFADNDLTQALENMEDILRRNGFYHTDVRPQVTREASNQTVDIRFSIDSGRRAKLSGAEFTGNPARSQKALLDETGWKKPLGLFGWREYTENRLQSGLQNIRSWYERHNHLLATASLTKLAYDDERNTVAPVIDIQAGPSVKVMVHGGKISGSRLRSILPIYQERSVDQDLVQEGKRDLTEYFQAQGYFDSAVSLVSNTERDGVQTIDYRVSRGGRHKLVAVLIDGNHYFSYSTLRERMLLIPATFFRYRAGRFSTQYLNRDLNSIRDLYQANGFRDVEVKADQLDNYSGRPEELGIKIHIDEGPQYFVSELMLTGLSDNFERALRLMLASTAGQPYSDFNITSDRTSTLEYLFNNGYPNAVFEFSAEPADLPHQVILKFKITPGERQYLRSVVVSGLETTKQSVVDKRINLVPGEPLDRTRIQEAQSRLYDLGVFAKVNVALQNPEGDEPTKNVLYSLEEARRYSVTVGGGAELGRIGGGATDLNQPQGATGFSPRFSLGVNRLNFLGLGQTLGFQGTLSTLEQRALITDQFPQFAGDPNLGLTLAALYDASKNVRTFSARREEGSLQLNRKYTKAVSVQYRYTFRRVNIVGTPLVSPELIPLVQRPERVGSLSLTVIQDRRDDPIDAHKGMYNTLDLGMATQFLGSNTGFGRVVGRNATYHRLTRNLVLAREVLVGTIDRFSGLSEIPVPERFFSGGTSSHRAFPDFQAGPRDLKTGFPIGGNALLLNTTEIRFPLIGDNVGGVLFNDMGNVYSSFSDISLRWRQRNLQDFNYGVQAFGFGVRYKTPVGPLRIDLSLSPNSPRFFGFKGTEQQLLFGTGEQVAQRINVFQFHFSLGQAF